MIQNDRLCDMFAEQLKKRLADNLKKIILFGSRARKDNYPGSDYDYMAVVKDISPGLNDTIDELAAEFMYEYNAVFSVFPVSENRYDTEIQPSFYECEKGGNPSVSHSDLGCQCRTIIAKAFRSLNAARRNIGEGDYDFGSSRAVFSKNRQLAIYHPATT